MSNLTTLPKGDSAWLLRKSIQRIMQQVSVLETNIGSSTTGNSSNTQVIFNDNGTLRGDAGLTYNAATDTLSAASATITGDLTVDTNVLKVDTTNNRVGINNATPLCALHIGTTGGTNKLAINTAVVNSGDIQLKRGGFIGFSNAADAGNSEYIFANAGALEIGVNASTRFAIASDGVATWSNVGGVAGTAMTLNSTGLGVGVSPAVKGHFYSASGSNELRLETAATGAGSTNRLSFKNASGATDARTGAIEWYDVASFKGDIRLLKAGGIQIRNSADVPTFNLDDTGNVGIGVTPSYKLDTYTTLQGAVTAKQFANRTANKILVKRFFGITADTALFSVECGTAGAGAMAAFEINVFATGQKSGSSGDRQFYGKWYVTRNLAGAFTITSAFSSGSSGAFTVAASGTSLNVNGIFSVISDGSACVEVTGYIGGRDTVVETALNVTMP